LDQILLGKKVTAQEDPQRAPRLKNKVRFMQNNHLIF